MRAVFALLPLLCSVAWASDWAPRASEKDRRDVVNTLKAALQLPRGPARDGALEQAAQRPDALLDVLAMPDAVPEGIYRAAYRAAELQGADAEEQLLRELARGLKLKTPELALERLTVLAQRGEDTVSERLLIAFVQRSHGARDHVDLGRFMPYLGRGGSRQSIPVLLRLFEDLNPTIGNGDKLARALADVGRRHPAEVVAAVSKRLRSAEGTEACYQARALGLLADPAGLPVLKERARRGLQSRRDLERPLAPELGEIISAVGKIGTVEAVEFLFELIELLPHGDDAARGAVCGAFQHATREPVQVTDFVARLVDTLVEAEDQGWPAGVRGGLVAALRRLTGRRYGVDSRVWQEYVSRQGGGLAAEFR